MGTFQHEILNLKLKWNARSNDKFILFNIGFLEIEPLQLMFLSGINHGFHSSYVHPYLLHTHDALICYEYGVFHINTNDILNLKIKLNGVYSMIEAQIMGISISKSQGM